MKSELSARELEVITYAVQGYTDEMIAQELRIERGTVNSYWVRIRGKFGNLSRTELVARFVQKNADAQHTEVLAEKEAAIASLSAEHEELLEQANREIARLKSLLKQRAG
jgi:DNA-binding CsgD family transcriptional regulator